MEQHKVLQYILTPLNQVINTSPCNLSKTCILALHLHIRNIISNNYIHLC